MIISQHVGTNHNELMVCDYCYDDIPAGAPVNTYSLDRFYHICGKHTVEVQKALTALGFKPTLISTIGEVEQVFRINR